MHDQNQQAYADGKCDLDPKVGDHLVIRAVLAKIVVDLPKVLGVEKLALDVGNDHEVPIVPIGRVDAVGERPARDEQQ